MTWGQRDALNLFFSYSHKDDVLREELEVHLSVLKRQGLVNTWHDRDIAAGTEWAGQIDAHLESADMILLLVSPDFIASDYCWDVEVKRALERHEAGQARVIPIILRPADWDATPFAKLQALPRDAKPLTTWPDRDAAFLDVVASLRKLIEEKKTGSLSDYEALKSLADGMFGSDPPA